MSTNLLQINIADWMSQAEAARLRGCTRQAISKLIKKQKLHTLEVGGHVLVNRIELMEYEDGSAGRPKTIHDTGGTGIASRRNKKAD
jgi:excisionase family DNA binding protein